MLQNQDITIASTLELYGGSHINKDLLLIENIAKFSMPQVSRRVACLFLAVCRSGQFSYTLDTIPYQIEPNHIVIISPGQTLDDAKVAADSCAFGIMISEDFFQETIANIHELSSLFIFSKAHPVCKLQANEMEKLENYFRALHKMVDNTTHHFRTEVVKSLFKTMIYDLGDTMFRIQSSEDRKQYRADKIFSDYIDLVEKNFKVQRRVSWYAQQLHITHKYLSESVKAASHRTPNEWIDYYVIMEIRVLLKTTAKSIKDITDLLHFPNQSFLGKFFKEHVGMSPRQYRNQA